MLQIEFLEQNTLSSGTTSKIYPYMSQALHKITYTCLPSKITG